MAGVYATEMYTKELKRVLDDYLERVASLAVGVAPPPLLLCRRTPIGVIRFGVSLRSDRTVLENTIE